MKKELLNILVCPLSKGPLIYDRSKNELISLSMRLAYPIRNGVPIMLEEEARSISEEEYVSYRSK